MKNLLSISLVFSMFMLFSCGEATTTVNDGEKTEVAKCGEEGHECSEACHAKKEEGHADHGHDHGDHGHADHDHGAKKAHVCNADCKEGECSLKCGEEGHECSEACHSKDLAEHTCSDDCKEGACSYKCGEKGHECTADCKA